MIKIGAFIAIVLVFLLLVEIKTRHDDHSYLKLKKEYLDRQADSIAVLIVGPSHTYRAIDPGKITLNTLSLAMPNSAFNVDYALFELAMKTVRPRYVIFDLSRGYLDKENSGAWFNDRKLNYYFGLREGPFELKNLFLARYPLYDELLKPPRPDLYNRWGFKSVVTKKEDKFKRINYDLEIVRKSKKLQKLKTQLKNKMDPAVRQRNVERLKRAIARSRSIGAQVVLINPPKFFIYNDAFNEEIGDIYGPITDSLVQDSGVLYWNLEKMGEDDPTNFYNLSHMSLKGAELFTAEVDRRLLEMEQDSPGSKKKM